MRKLCLGLSFFAMAAFVACSDSSGTDSEPPENSSNSSLELDDEYDGEVVEFGDLPKCSERRDGKVYYVEDEDITYTCRYDENEETGEWVSKKKKARDDDKKTSSSSGELVDEYDGAVEEFGDLPKCSERRDGKVYYVEDEDVTYTCRYDEDEEAGEWVRKKKEPADDDDQESSSSVENADDSSSSEESEDYSSSSEELDDESSSSEELDDESSSSEELDDDSSSSEESEDDSSSSEKSDSDSSSSEEFEDESSSSDASIYDATANTLTDLRDGQVYRTTAIEVNDTGSGISYSEVWMAENLNFETENSWCGGGSGTTEGDCSIYGRLYKWAAAVAKPEDECGYGHECSLGTGDIRGACPKGWHVPSYGEWDELFTAVGGSSVAGKVLKSETGWQSYSGIENSDTYLFSALPAGFRDYYGNYYNEGDDAYLWSSTEYGSYNAYGMYLYYSLNNAYLDGGNKGYGYSVRCLKD